MAWNKNEGDKNLVNFQTLIKTNLELENKRKKMKKSKKISARINAETKHDVRAWIRQFNKRLKNYQWQN